MLEILFLLFFCRRLANIAKAKGRSGAWGGLGAAFWIGGEIVGVGIGLAADAGMGAYLLALVFAVVGAIIAYVIVKNLRDEMAAAMEMVGPAYEPRNLGPPADPSNPYSPPRAY
jgi:hypothetical protein